jgi:large conductance mechanosensitive channel
MPKPPKTSGIVYEFKAFVNRGSVVDVAVAFVMGATFKTVIDAVAGDGKDNQGILGGLVGAVFGGNRPNFNDKGIALNGSFIPVGSLFTAILNFLMVSTVMFFVIKAYGRFRDVKAEETTNDLLKSIRDELREQNKQ